jgi:CyaY protein
VSEATPQQPAPRASQTTLNEEAFERKADEELRILLDVLIESEEEIDPDLESGVLSIHFDDGAKYVVNSHRAARQIWMAADRQAWHFDYVPGEAGQPGQWQSSNGDELWTALCAALSRRLDSPISLSRRNPA